MTRNTLTLTLAGVLCVMLACVLSIPPVKAQGPIGGALATLAAATAQAQVERQQQEATYAAQRATVQAILIEQTRTAAQVQATATRQAFAVQSTATAQSAEATQTALNELQRQRAMTATAQQSAIMATGTALAQSAKATTTAEALSAQATAEAYRTQATAQAVELSVRATDTAKMSQTYAERQARFSFGLLIVELGFIAGALLIIAWLTRTLVLWAKRLAPQPTTGPSLADVLTASKSGPVVIEQAAEPEARMPNVVQVVDNPAMVEALDRWAERYDEEQGVSDDD
jgi:hypothetical protein